jgi:hypothetical protein
MWAVTGWAVVTWLKLTAVLTATVAVAGWQLGTGTGGFWIVGAAAVTVEVYAIRQLAREWADEARSSWWWSP